MYTLHYFPLQILTRSLILHYDHYLHPHLQSHVDPIHLLLIHLHQRNLLEVILLFSFCNLLLCVQCFCTSYILSPVEVSIAGRKIDSVLHVEGQFFLVLIGHAGSFVFHHGGNGAILLR